MSRYKSIIYRELRGPEIFACIQVNRGKITQVVMEKGKGPGIEWQIIADEPSREIEEKISQWMVSYCSCKQPTVELPFNLDGLSIFIRSVLNTLLEIPFGKSLSYQEVAQEVGTPKAYRAVGSACGKNPIAFFIPCHRVLASGGGLGGFSLDISVKKALLAFEGHSIKS